MFDIPIVLFTFKRKKVIEVLKVIKSIDPLKIYILSDGPRNDSEKKEVEECRKAIESELLNLSKTEIIRRYSDINLGVYENIAEGAKWVLSREETAIFIEDDNLPCITFFQYCKELLEKYKDEEKVLWICGTNYLEKYHSQYSYIFTHHMLPCGWATWRDKFLKYYDGNLENLTEEGIIRAKNNFVSNALFRQFRGAWIKERQRILDGNKPVSWDYQMDFTIKYYGLYGISPCFNQIRNIGADDDAAHGGNNIKKGLASKFCEKKTYEINFPLVDPPSIEIDQNFERKIGKIMLSPFWDRVHRLIFGSIRKVLKVPYDKKFKDFIMDKFEKDTK